MRLTATFLGLALAGLLAVPDTARAATFRIVPHRAVYSMALVRGAGGSISNVDGSMLFEWADSCDGWTVTQRTSMTFLYVTGESMQVGYNVVAWESKDGLRYRFFVRRTQTGEEATEMRGDARLDGPGGAGVAHYTAPAEKTVPLPPGTLFPTAHSLRLIERAQSGPFQMYGPVFDGSDESGLFDVSAAGGVDMRPRADAPASPLLEGGASWGFGLAFYEIDSRKPVPEHEQFVRLRSNGVVEDMMLDYGQFAVDAKLVRLEPLPPPPC
jgi:hypothetical protein